MEKDIPLERMIEIIYECEGKVRNIAKVTGYGIRAVYDYLEVYPELVEHRKKASMRVYDFAMESAQEVLDKLMDTIEEDRSNARGTAQFILRYGQNSPYNVDKDKVALENDLANTDMLINRVNARLERAKSERETMSGDSGIDS